MSAVFVFALAVLATAVSAGAIPDNLLEVPVFIRNKETKRFLFCGGEKSKGWGADGGWSSSSDHQPTTMQGTDANYYNLAIFVIFPVGRGVYALASRELRRYALSAGEPLSGPPGSEGGWLISSGFQSPPVVGADANYENRAAWSVSTRGDSYTFTSVATKRLLFSTGPPIKGIGAEGGWLSSSGYQAPDIVGTDANYYGRAEWTIEKV